MDTKPELLRPGLFRDRREAGRLLAAKLAKYGGRPDVIVLALPRGGVPVAYEVASALGAPLDVFVVRKLGVPGYAELAMGAVATGARVARGHRCHRRGPPPAVRCRLVILAEDGLATGATMLAAIQALRQQQPKRI